MICPFCGEPCPYVNCIFGGCWLWDVREEEDDENDD